MNANAWARDDFVTKPGWGAMPGAEKLEAGVAAERASRMFAARSS